MGADSCVNGMGWHWDRSLDIQYNTEAIRTICLSKKAAERKFGKEFAAKLHSRLSDIRAAENVFEIPVGLKTQIDGVFGEIRAFALTPEYQMKFKANNKDGALSDDGKIDWSAVDRVQILMIEMEPTS